MFKLNTLWGKIEFGEKGKFNVDPVFLFFVYSYLIGVFERSLYGIGKTAHSADRFIGGGTNVSFELGNETFYWLIKACHQIQIHLESNNHIRMKCYQI